MIEYEIIQLIKRFVVAFEKLVATIEKAEREDK